MKELFGRRRPIIGVVHLLPLLGSPREHPLSEAIGRAVVDARSLAAGGVDGVIVENYGDLPFLPQRVEPHTIAAMSVIAFEVRRSISIPLGINVLRNDADGALAVATVVGAEFIRVNVHTGVMIAGEGFLVGNAHQTLRYRSRLRSRVKIFADLLVKHARSIVDKGIEEAAREAAYRGLADAIIVTGPETGWEADLGEVERVRGAVPGVPVFVGSGVKEENVATILERADGIIVGTEMKKDGITENEVDLERVKRLLKKAGA